MLAFGEVDSACAFGAECSFGGEACGVGIDGEGIGSLCDDGAEVEHAGGVVEEVAGPADGVVGVVGDGGSCVGTEYGDGGVIEDDLAGAGDGLRADEVEDGAGVGGLELPCAVVGESVGDVDIVDIQVVDEGSGGDGDGVE